MIVIVDDWGYRLAISKVVQVKDGSLGGAREKGQWLLHEPLMIPDL